MFKMKAFISNNVIRNFANGFLNKNINFGFSQMLTHTTNNLFSLKDFNYNFQKDVFTEANFVSELNIERNNNEIESNVEKIEFKNKSRKVAERKRKKRKTGKDIRIRWR